jgi:hypothetical protein
MRKLNKKQKKALLVWYKGSGSCILDDMNSDEYNRIYEMNEYETFHQDASRYLWDLNTLGNIV